MEKKIKKYFEEDMGLLQTTDFYRFYDMYSHRQTPTHRSTLLRSPWGPYECADDALNATKNLPDPIKASIQVYYINWDMKHNREPSWSIPIMHFGP